MITTLLLLSLYVLTLIARELRSSHRHCCAMERADAVVAALGARGRA